MKFIELVEEYLEQQKYSIKERTYLFYKKVINNHIRDELGELNIKLINQDIVNNFIFEKYKKGNKKTNKDLSYSTIMVIIGIVNRTLKYGFKRKYLKNKLEVDIKIKKYNDKKVEALSKEEQRKIESYIVNKNKIYSYGVLLSLYTGMRIGELLALKWNDIDFKNKLINVKRTVCKITKNNKTITIESTPKTNSSVREIPLTNSTIILLKDLKKYQENKSEYVISTKTGKQIDMRAYQTSFSRLLKRLNIKHYGFHSLRHTFATRCLELGVDIKTLSELLGHSSPTITLNRYIHSNMNLKRVALNKISKQLSMIN